MASESEPRVPWDEAAALEELERLRRGIEEWRRRRNDVQAEFDRFVRGFRTSALEAAIAESTAVAQPPEVLRNDVPRSDTPTVQSSTADPVDAPTIVAASAWPLTSDTATDRDLNEPVTPPGTSVLEPADSPSVPLPATIKPHFRIKWNSLPRRLVLVPVLVVLAVTGTLLSRGWRRAPPGSREAIPAARTTQPTPQPAPSAATQPPAPVNAGPPRSEIMAVRRVWVRVVVGGVKMTERELQAGERVPLPAGSTAAVRAGNAGAVQVTINGEDRGLLGAEGEVVTRTLQIPASPVR
jgi:hypothetical protein